MTANQIAYWANQERIRNDIATVNESYRSNRAREVENHRHGVASEGLTFMGMNESIRHNQATEGQAARQLLADISDRNAKNRIAEGGIIQSNVNSKRQADTAVATTSMNNETSSKNELMHDVTSIASSVIGGVSGAAKEIIPILAAA